MNPWAILGIILALSAIGGGIFTAGKRVERATWAARVVEETKLAYEARDKSLARVAEIEAKSRKTVSDAESKASKEISDAKTTADRIVSQSGKRELRITALCAADNQRTATEAGSIAREAAEREAAELRRAYVEPFISLAREADEVTIERNECVAIALKDREP